MREVRSTAKSITTVFFSSLLKEMESNKVQMSVWNNQEKNSCIVLCLYPISRKASTVNFSIVKVIVLTTKIFQNTPSLKLSKFPPLHTFQHIPCNGNKYVTKSTVCLLLKNNNKSSNKTYKL